MLEDRGADAHHVVAIERALPGQHLVEDRSEGEEVAARIHFATLDLLGRHIAHGTDDVAAARRARGVVSVLFDRQRVRRGRGSADVR